MNVLENQASPYKVVIVTGGGSGIGAAISHAFLSCDYQVVIAQRSKPSQSELEELDNIDYRMLDLNDHDSIPHFINNVLEEYGNIHVLVNNAGQMTQASASVETLANWQRSINVNLTAPFLLIQHALPALIKSRGSIINIGSIEGLAANPNHAAYCASKAGLHGLTQSVAVDYGKHGVRCNAIAPGWIDTEFNDEYINTMPNPSKFRQGLAAIHPTGAIGKAQDIAELAVWLASEKATFVTGQIWKVDGGRMSQLSAPSL